MPYIREECVAGDTIEICKYYTYRSHVKGEKRAKKKKLTSEAQKRVNQRKAEKELRRSMNANFRDGDLLVRYDFFKEFFPVSSDDMGKLMKKFIRKLRTEFKKAGKELKYIYVKEVGPRGGRHIHMMMSKCDLDILRKCWTHGGIHVDPLISGNQYRKIAAYFIKYSARTEETEGKLIGKRWYPSKNLVKPQVTKKVIRSNKFREDIPEKDGYYVEKDSVISGISDFTGFQYFSYTYIKTKGAGG